MRGIGNVSMERLTCVPMFVGDCSGSDKGPKGQRPNQCQFILSDPRYKRHSAGNSRYNFLFPLLLF